MPNLTSLSSLSVLQDICFQ